MKNVGRIGTNRVSFLFNTTIVRLNIMQIHIVAYYKYQVFKRFPVDIWEDICAWFNTRKGSFFMDWSFKPALKYLKYDGELKCPLKGDFLVSYNNISYNKEFPLIPLVPSGQYRLDSTLTEANRSIIIGFAQLYITVSDNRIEQY